MRERTVAEYRTLLAHAGFEQELLTITDGSDVPFHTLVLLGPWHAGLRVATGSTRSRFRELAARRPA